MIPPLFISSIPSYLSVLDSVLDAAGLPCRQIDLAAHFTMWTHKSIIDDLSVILYHLVNNNCLCFVIDDYERLYRRSAEAQLPTRAICGWPCASMSDAKHAFENSHPCLKSLRGDCKDESVAHRTYYRHVCVLSLVFSLRSPLIIMMMMMMMMMMMTNVIYIGMC
jgi:hypothetical protein